MTALDTSLAAASWSGAVFCPTRCYACQFDECPGVPHSWGDPEDFAHAWTTWQDAPGFCGCECGRPARSTRIEIRSTDALKDLRDIPGFESIRARTWSWRCPGCKSGRAAGRDEALAKAYEHRGSADCRHRRAEP